MPPAMRPTTDFDDGATAKQMIVEVVGIGIGESSS
jgi:hypothetical protein